MKTTMIQSSFKFLAMAAVVSLSLQSCSNDDDSVSLNAPVISNFEFGEGSTHSTSPVAYKGSDIHLEAEITAEATVKSIALSIHSHDLTPSEGEVEWDYEMVYTHSKYLVINPEFHEHVDVPSNIPAGEYHIELVVTDELGNSTEIDGHINIMDPIAISDVSIDATVARGSDFHAEFMIDAVHGIHNITVDVHAHGLTPGAGEVEWDFEQIFDGDKYHGKTEVEFHEHIDVPATAPAGEYHIEFTVEDEEGNTVSYDAHIDVTE